MPAGWLVGTPLTGWVLPGVALVIGVAVPQLAAAALIGAGARPGRRVPGRAASGRLDRSAAADPAALLLPPAGHRGHRRRRDPARLALAAIREDRHRNPGPTPLTSPDLPDEFYAMAAGGQIIFT